MTKSYGKNTYFCTECLLRFTLMTKHSYRKVFCPTCGESVGIKRYEPYKDVAKGAQAKRPWTKKEEMILLDFRNNKKMTFPHIGLKLNRSQVSVRDKYIQLMAYHKTARTN